jgi:ribosomal protein L11 methylase PrmA
VDGAAPILADWSMAWVAIPFAAALRTPLSHPYPAPFRARLPVAYDGGPAPTSEHAVLAEDAAELENGAMLLVRMQCPQSVDGHLWSELLVDAGALFVSLSDADAGTDAEEAIYHAHPPGATSAELLERSGADCITGHLTPVWSNSRLEVGFAPGVDVEATLLLAAAVAGEPPPRFEVEVLGARDWVAQVQTDWTPIELAGCLRILFPWHESDDAHPLPSIRLQPGMAFGTGEHATTQLCCRALHSLLNGRLSNCSAMLDYGSGSGILALAALLFGCQRAVGVEIDPYALKGEKALMSPPQPRLPSPPHFQSEEART